MCLAKANNFHFVRARATSRLGENIGHDAVRVRGRNELVRVVAGSIAHSACQEFGIATHTTNKSQSNITKQTNRQKGKERKKGAMGCTYSQCVRETDC